jgi:hypothetical protein
VLQRIDEYRVRITFSHLGEGTARTAKAISRRWTRDRSVALEVAADVRTGGRCSVTYTVGGKQYVSVVAGGQAHNDVTAAGP